MSADPTTVMTWTRHTERVSSRHPGLGIVGLTIGCVMGFFAASDGVWPPVSLAVFLASGSPVLFTKAVLRLEVGEDAILVRRQPLGRNPAVFISAGIVAAGLVLVAAYADGYGLVWVWVGVGISLAGVVLGVLALRAQPFHINREGVVFAGHVEFPFETLTASIDYGIRSDDLLQLAANRTLLGGPKRYVGLRAYGIHPNTSLSTIHQIQAWRREGVPVTLRTVAAMLSIPDQPDVPVRDSVEFRLPAGATPVRVSDPG